ncbi:MAG: trypsin-like peptidase domain-containing protein [Patescibacteria group bacterium]|nr:trypsin-like peptidase domain-containing protein [Patescibacteria group bacterium]
MADSIRSRILPASILGLFIAVGAIAYSMAQSSAALPQTTDIPDVVARTNPAVVSIVGTMTQNAIDPFTGKSQPVTQTLGGSGFLVSPDGLIVTNKHVIDSPDISYKVVTYDGKQFPMTVVAKDPVLDIALVRIKAGSLPYLSFADSSKVRLGQTAIAIGNALGQFQNTVSVGVISGLSRSVTAFDLSGQPEQYDELIQTDAAINPGNSGGPLLDSNGDVVGVNVAEAQGSQNINFAIPSNTVSADVQSVLASGKITRAQLGVRYVTVTPALRQALGLAASYGALVSAGVSGQPAVIPGSAAAKAGIRAGDIIQSINGISLKDRSLSTALQGFKPGDKVSIGMVRNGKPFTVQAALGGF